MTERDDILSDPVQHIDLERVESVADLVSAFREASFQSRSLGRCAEIYEKALADPSCTIFLGMAGALLAGGLRKVIRDMIHHGLVDVVVSNGAIPYHDFYEARGYRHYKTTPQADDVMLRSHFLDRVYDTLADEEKFRETDEAITRLADGLEPRNYSTREFMRILGESVEDEHSIVRTAAVHGVPFFVPALNDSSIGIALAKHYDDAKKSGRTPIAIDTIRDTWEITQIKIKAPRTGMFFVSGGVPRNYVQQTEVTAEVLGHAPEPHYYAMALTMDSPQWGGLSGSTFQEAQSWGKVHKHARMVQAYVEATVGLPLIVGYLLQRGAAKDRQRRRFRWEADELVELA
jgi:deoxyhypusine synthase